MKIQILDRTIDVDISELFDEADIVTASANILKLTELLNEGETAKFKVDHYMYENGSCADMQIYRLETDEEYANRLEEERIKTEKAERKRLAALEKSQAKAAKKEAQRLANEAIERAEYLRLKEKYG